MDEERLVSPEEFFEETEEPNIRPSRLSEYVGQAKARENLEIFIQAARQRHDPLDHVLLYGPPGLGKPPWPILSRRKWGPTCGAPQVRPLSGPVIWRRF